MYLDSAIQDTCLMDIQSETFPPLELTAYGIDPDNLLGNPEKDWLEVEMGLLEFSIR